MGELTGRTALVTGASRGIGAACARAIDAAGARVAVSARSRTDLETVASSLANDPVVLVADLAADGAAAELASAAADALGRVDVLVNNAGQSMMGPSGALDPGAVATLFTVNQASVLLLAGRIGAAMAAGGGGSIVNVSSVAGQTGVAGQAAYAATKGAVDAMTRSLAAELGPSGVRVNAVNPGVIETDMWEAGLKVPGVRAYLERYTPLRRIGRAEDVADAVVFLASDRASFVTAQTLAVDGGALDTFVLLPPALTDR